jgi:hypothetical protein
LESLLLVVSLGLLVEVVVVVGCLVLFSAGMFASLRWGMLFVGVAEDRRLLVEVCVFGLRGECSCMVGSIAKAICGSWVGILGDGCSFGKKVGLRLMIVRVGSSGKYG